MYCCRYRSSRPPAAEGSPTATDPQEEPPESLDPFGSPARPALDTPASQAGSRSFSCARATPASTHSSCLAASMTAEDPEFEDGPVPFHSSAARPVLSLRRRGRFCLEDTDSDYDSESGNAVPVFCERAQRSSQERSAALGLGGSKSQPPMIARPAFATVPAEDIPLDDNGLARKSELSSQRFEDLQVDAQMAADAALAISRDDVAVGEEDSKGVEAGDQDGDITAASSGFSDDDSDRPPYLEITSLNSGLGSLMSAGADTDGPPAPGTDILSCSSPGSKAAADAGGSPSAQQAPGSTPAKPGLGYEDGRSQDANRADADSRFSRLETVRKASLPCVQPGLGPARSALQPTCLRWGAEMLQSSRARAEPKRPWLQSPRRQEPFWSQPYGDDDGQTSFCTRPISPRLRLHRTVEHADVLSQLMLGSTLPKKHAEISARHRSPWDSGESFMDKMLADSQLSGEAAGKAAEASPRRRSPKPHSTARLESVLCESDVMAPREAPDHVERAAQAAHASPRSPQMYAAAWCKLAAAADAATEDISLAEPISLEDDRLRAAAAEAEAVAEVSLVVPGSLEPGQNEWSRRASRIPRAMKKFTPKRRMSARPPGLSVAAAAERCSPLRITLSRPRVMWAEARSQAQTMPDTPAMQDPGVECPSDTPTLADAATLARLIYGSKVPCGWPAASDRPSPPAGPATPAPGNPDTRNGGDTGHTPLPRSVVSAIISPGDVSAAFTAALFAAAGVCPSPQDGPVQDQAPAQPASPVSCVPTDMGLQPDGSLEGDDQVMSDDAEAVLRGPALGICSAHEPAAAQEASTSILEKRGPVADVHPGGPYSPVPTLSSDDGQGLDADAVGPVSPYSTETPFVRSGPIPEEAHLNKSLPGSPDAGSGLDVDGVGMVSSDSSDKVCPWSVQALAGGSDIACEHSGVSPGAAGDSSEVDMAMLRTVPGPQAPKNGIEDGSGAAACSPAAHGRFCCPFPGCDRSFAHLWRLRMHYRTPPELGGPDEERGHGSELPACPKCSSTLVLGKHHGDCQPAASQALSIKPSSELPAADSITNQHRLQLAQVDRPASAAAVGAGRPDVHARAAAYAGSLGRSAAFAAAAAAAAAPSEVIMLASDSDDDCREVPGIPGR